MEDDDDDEIGFEKNSLKKHLLFFGGIS